MRQILVLAGILGGGWPVLAQTAPPPATPPTFSDTLVVSASLGSEERDAVPATATVIDDKEIAARQVAILSDLIATVPGVNISQAGGAGQQTSLFLRGSNSNQTLLLWNGIPLNDPYFGGANWQFVPLDGVARVEVVRGPFSALYGTDAVGGVIQVLTGTRQGGSFDLEGGSHGYGRGGVAAGTDLGPVRLDLTGHLRRGDGDVANERFDSGEAVVRALWSLTPGVGLGLMARGNDSKTGVPFSSGLPTPNSEISWREREIAVPFRADQSDWSLDAQLSRTTFDSTFRNPDDPFGFTKSDTDSEAQRGRAVVSYQVGHGLTLAGGGDWERLKVDNSSSFGTNLDGARQRTWAAFGQASYGMGPVHLEVGVRRDDNDVYGSHTSLRTGAVVQLAQGTRLRASYGEAFRAPSLGELFFPFSGNPDLKPETVRSWEVGIEQEVRGAGGNWRFSLTGFENRRRTLIDFTPVTFVDVNVGRARSRGAEGQVAFDRGGYSARLNGTYLEALDLETGLALLRRPRHGANLQLIARPGEWTLSATGRFVGERADLDPATF
ncbi:MAG TPA: TonB-dependent receptor, partial [Thermoanaerobaculia bacterium]